MQGADAEISEIVCEFFFCSWNGAESWEKWIIFLVVARQQDDASLNGGSASLLE